MTSIQQTVTEKAAERFIGEAITPEGVSFAPSTMATGAPGLPQTFLWRRKKFSVLAVVERWKDCGDCRHGSGERYVRRHWFRVQTAEGPEMNIYFERQGRPGSRARWRLYSIREAEAEREH